MGPERTRLAEDSGVARYRDGDEHDGHSSCRDSDPDVVGLHVPAPRRLALALLRTGSWSSFRLAPFVPQCDPFWCVAASVENTVDAAVREEPFARVFRNCNCRKRWSRFRQFPIRQRGLSMRSDAPRRSRTACLTAPTTMEREQRDKQAASSVVYLFQERVELGVRCQRGWEPQPGQVKRAPHRPGRQVPRDDNREDEHEKSPVHDARHEIEERGLIREIGGAPPDPVPHAPAQKQRSYRAPAHVEGAGGGALVGEEQRHDQDCGEPVDHDGQERVAIDRPPTIEHVTDHAAASLGGSCRSPRPRRTCTTWSTSSCAPAIRATPTSTA